MGDVIYVTQPSGARFKACSCIRDSWPTINKLARLKGYIRQQIDVTQGSYSTSVNASALTHAGGGVLDVQVTGTALDSLLEECGIAAYERTAADGFKPHSHILWIGCPHLHAQAAAQVASWRNLRNGLRSNALDRDQTRPAPVRDWIQGLAWATQQLEDDMALSTDDKNWIANQIAQINSWKATFGSPDDTAGSRLSRILIAAEAAASNTRPITRGGEERPVRQELADVLTLTLAQAGELAGLKAALSTLAGGGLDLAAVEAAAKRGVEAGLAGAQVVIDFPKEEQA